MTPRPGLSLARPIKQRLKAGEVVFGTWSILPAPALVEILGLGGLDFVILDMEHGAYDLAAIDNCIRACESTTAAPLVRIPGMNASAAQWVLDLGAHGIVVPQVDDEVDAARVVSIAKFHPDGSRGYNPFTRAADYSNPADNTSGKLDNKFSLITAIVESARALANLEKICATPYLDVIYVGVYDLAVAMGHAGDTKHPAVAGAVESAIRTIRSSGKAAGMMVRSREEIARALDLGANFLVYSVESSIILESVKAAVSVFNGEREVMQVESKQENTP